MEIFDIFNSSKQKEKRKKELKAFVSACIDEHIHKEETGRALWEACLNQIVHKVLSEKVDGVISNICQSITDNQGSHTTGSRSFKAAVDWLIAQAATEEAGLDTVRDLALTLRHDAIALVESASAEAMKDIRQTEQRLYSKIPEVLNQFDLEVDRLIAVSKEKVDAQVAEIISESIENYITSVGKNYKKKIKNYVESEIGDIKWRAGYEAKKEIDSAINKIALLRTRFEIEVDSIMISTEKSIQATIESEINEARRKFVKTLNDEASRLPPRRYRSRLIGQHDDASHALIPDNASLKSEVDGKIISSSSSGKLSTIDMLAIGAAFIGTDYLIQRIFGTENLFTNVSIDPEGNIRAASPKLSVWISANNSFSVSYGIGKNEDPVTQMVLIDGFGRNRISYDGNNEEESPRNETGKSAAPHVSPADIRKEGIMYISFSTCNVASRKGAWGCVMRWKDTEKHLCGYEQYASTEENALKGMIAILDSINRPTRFVLHTDNRYVFDGISTIVSPEKISTSHHPDYWKKIEGKLKTHKCDFRLIEIAENEPDLVMARQIAQQEVSLSR